jgi:hypothetical protein
MTLVLISVPNFNGTRNEMGRKCTEAATTRISVGRGMGLEAEDAKKWRGN